MKKGSFSTVLLIIVLVAGLSLMLYPSFSNYWNDLHQTKAIANYTEAVAKLDDKDYSHVWEAAIAYNESLLLRDHGYKLTEEQKISYEHQFNIAGNGIIGYIDIPGIDIFLPIYHGTSEGVLQVAIGHIEWSSLPTGGENTHCVVSGHRGLPSAKLFSDLDKLKVGDRFIFNILDQSLTYEVDQINIVEPYELNDLRILEGQDLCTLVTCTPYGVNSHRLLVRGHRVENEMEEEVIRISNDAIQIEPLLVAPVVAAPILLSLLILLFTTGKKQKNKS